MTNPVLVEVTRGGAVESRHHGAVAVCDAEGHMVLAMGDVDRPVFPRSAVKAIQALPMVESGAPGLFGLTQEQLALACASHSGESGHVAGAAAMLAACGRHVGTLECGAHWPLGEAAARALAASGAAPSALHNNCSGKHAGFVCLACATGHDPAGYIGRAHPVQRAVTAALESVTGVNLRDAPIGADGCGIPTFAIPLRALARGFARLGTGHGLEPQRAAAAARLRAAVAAHPWMVAGTGRFDTVAMSALGARVFCKTGAEGVFCAALPEQGLGVAIKCDDGATRAAEAIMAHVIARYVPLGTGEQVALGPLIAPQIKRWNGDVVGAIQVAAEIG